MTAKRGKKGRIAEFLAGVADLAANLRLHIDAAVLAFPVDAAASAARRVAVQAGEDGFRCFCHTYFPHYCSAAPAVLHEWLYTELPRLIDAPAGCRLAVAAPRGNAKSTLVTQLFVLWCIVTGRKHYACLIMDALDQSLSMLEAIKAELEANPRLQMDFPDIAGQGRVWQVGVILTRNHIKIQAFGSGKRMRGLRHGPHRPDLVIGDDLENDENVANPSQRDKVHNWLRRTVLSLGAADDSMDVIIIGTVLHYDSVLSRLLRDPLWRGRKFRALIELPHRMDLWDIWGEILLNEGEAAARDYYNERAAVMEAGAVVNWPALQPLYTLMFKRYRDGIAAFDSEQQNEPVSGDAAPFANCMRFWVQPVRDWIYFGACDPSMGKQARGRDPSALIVAGLDRVTGVLDIVEASIRKRLPDRIISDVIALQQQYRCVLWVVEAVQFQEFFKDEMVKRAAAAGTPVPARGITPAADKALRIESLQPHFANGLIRLHPSQTTLIEQFRHFPEADHDDGPDAVHMVWMAAISGLGAIAYTGAGARHAATTGGGRRG